MSEYSKGDESNMDKLKNNRSLENDIEDLISSTYDDENDLYGEANAMQEQLSKLHLDSKKQQYVEENIKPLVSLLVGLSSTSFNLSNSAAVLTSNPIVSRKKSKLKDTIRLVYNINDECEDIYKIVKKRINYLLDDAKSEE
ncbi:MAG: hypothetical protein Q8936_18070 [Bacillota bacterium]|nr:hypothetical protein [Bacillota bacterium]